MRRIAEMDRDHWSIEASAGVEKTLLGIFEARNVPDDLQQAYGASFTDSNLGLYEHYREMLGRGDPSVMGFVSNLKGKVAEFRLIAALNERCPGYKFHIAENPTQHVWDIRGTDPEGVEDIYVQVKTGAASRAPEVADAMRMAPDNVVFAVSRDIYERVAEAHPELLGWTIDTGIRNLDFTSEIEDNLKVLSQNFGIDVPDRAGDILPYVREVVLGIRLLLDIVAVERDFRDLDLQDRRRVHALKALMLLSRFGVSSVLVQLGAAAGSLFPGPGTVAGSIAGASTATLLNRRLKPRMLDVAMKIADVNEDDLFYFKNKSKIDAIGASLAATTTMSL